MEKYFIWTMILVIVLILHQYMQLKQVRRTLLDLDSKLILIEKRLNEYIVQQEKGDTVQEKTSKHIDESRARQWERLISYQPGKKEENGGEG